MSLSVLFLYSSGIGHFLDTDQLLSVLIQIPKQETVRTALSLLILAMECLVIKWICVSVFKFIKGQFTPKSTLHIFLLGSRLFWCEMSHFGDPSLLLNFAMNSVVLEQFSLYQTITTNYVIGQKEACIYLWRRGLCLWKCGKVNINGSTWKQS